MRGFFDASCSKCGRHIGWCGGILDKPPCGSCGHHDKVDSDSLEKIAQLDRLYAVGYKATNFDLKEMRELSGLSQGQLAQRLVGANVASMVDRVELGKSTLRSSLIRRWVDLCGFGEKEPDTQG